MRLSVVARDETEVHEALARLFAARAAGATVCPSEVARALADAGNDPGKGDWRVEMPCVHAAIDQFLAAGLVTLSWKGIRLEKRAGPYRISAVEKLQATCRSATSK